MRKAKLLLLIPTAVFFTMILGLFNTQTEFSIRGGTVFRKRQLQVAKHRPWEQSQEKRRNILSKTCGQIFDVYHKNLFFDDILDTKKLFHQLVVDNHHKFLYCVIPKVAETQWEKLMMIMSGKTSVKDPEDPRIGNPHDLRALDVLQDYNDKERKEKLRNYKKFLFVRHPYERLISAYRDIFESEDKKSLILKVKYGPQIVLDYKLGDPIPFPKFIDFVLRTSWKINASLDVHWASYGELCRPCFVHYDFIGHYETLVEDSENILDHIGAPVSLHFPTRKLNRTSDLVKKYFSSLSEEQITELFEVYRIDFVLFGYNKTIDQSSKQRKVFR